MQIMGLVYSTNQSEVLKSELTQIHDNDKNLDNNKGFDAIADLSLSGSHIINLNDTVVLDTNTTNTQDSHINKSGMVANSAGRCRSRRSIFNLPATATKREVPSSSQFGSCLDETPAVVPIIHAADSKAIAKCVEIGADVSKSSKRSRSIPIFTKSAEGYDDHNMNRGSSSTSVTTSLAYDDAYEEEMHLKRMYDLRTWNMYMRITEARRHRKCIQAQNHNIPNVQTESHNSAQSTFLTNNTANAAQDTFWNVQNNHFLQQQLYPSKRSQRSSKGAQQQLQSANMTTGHYQVWYNSHTHIQAPVITFPVLLNYDPYSSIMDEGNQYEHELVFGDIE